MSLSTQYASSLLVLFSLTGHAFPYFCVSRIQFPYSCHSWCSAQFVCGFELSWSLLVVPDAACFQAIVPVFLDMVLLCPTFHNTELICPLPPRSYLSPHFSVAFVIKQLPKFAISAPVILRLGQIWTRNEIQRSIRAEVWRMKD